MKPIREQLWEQAVAIRQEWAKGPSPDGSPRTEAITLEFESPTLPMTAIRGYRGRVNSDLTYAPDGCLLFRGAETERTWNGVDFAQRVTVYLEYRDYPWNYLVLVATTTSLPAGKPKILVDSSVKPIYQSADFDALLDALEPPDDGPPTSPDGPSPDSWRDRPPLL